MSPQNVVSPVKSSVVNQKTFHPLVQGQSGPKFMKKKVEISPRPSCENGSVCFFQVISRSWAKVAA